MAQAKPIYPSRPVKVVVGFPAGQATDTIARLLGNQLALQMRQPFLIDNRPGQGGSLALGYLAQQPADGYTVSLANTGAVITNQFLQKKLSYTPKQLQPVALIGDIPLMLVANPSAPFKDLKGFIERARANPGRLTYATPGNGTTSHLAMESLKQAAKIDVLHVPYAGSSRSLNDLIAGLVDVSFDTVTTTQPFVESQKLRPLAIGSALRISALPDVPTLVESGFKDIIGAVWIGAFVPRGTPAAVIKQLEVEIGRAAREPETASRMRAAGFYVRLIDASGFESILRTDTHRIQQLVETSGATVD